MISAQGRVWGAWREDQNTPNRKKAGVMMRRRAELRKEAVCWAEGVGAALPPRREENRPDTGPGARAQQLKQSGQLEPRVTIKREEAGRKLASDLAVCIHGDMGAAPRKGIPDLPRKGRAPRCQTVRNPSPSPHTFSTGGCLARRAGEKVGRPALRRLLRD